MFLSCLSWQGNRSNNRLEYSLLQQAGCKVSDTSEATAQTQLHKRSLFASAYEICWQFLLLIFLPSLDELAKE
jgi:hypothetical protein